MAGDWMKFEKATLEKPEVFRIAGDLGIDPDAVVGKLLRVWNWFDDQSRDGHAPVTIETLLDRYTGVPGFVQAMERAGWMERTDDGRLCVPNFGRHNGSPAKSRASAQKRQQKHRSGVTDDVTPASQPERDTTVTREEKRREEDVEREVGNTRTRPKRPTLAQAKAAAAQIGVAADEAESWWHAREANDWMKGGGGGAMTPVGTNWQSDMKTYCERGYAKQESHNGANGHAPQKYGPMQIAGRKGEILNPEELEL